MAKGKSNPGLGFGLGAGTLAVNTCSSEDTSIFCQISRIFQVISWIFTILIFMWIAYMFLDIYVLSKNGRRSRGLF
jgi:hypothetical protein